MCILKATDALFGLSPDVSGLIGIPYSSHQSFKSTHWLDQMEKVSYQSKS